MMRIGEGVEWALHCCTVLAILPADGALPASRLAEFHDVPGAYLAKHLQALSRAGIVETTGGPRGGDRIAKPPAGVLLLEGRLLLQGGPVFLLDVIVHHGDVGLPLRPPLYHREIR